MQHVRAGLVAALFATAAMASGPDATTARASVVATDLANQSTVVFCDERAPGQVAKVRAAWTEWRQRNDVEAVTRRTDPAWIEKVRQSVVSNESALHAKMAERGAPDVVCAALPAAWREAGMDMRARYPLAYAEAASPSTAPQGVSASGTVFTVAQLQRHYATGSLDERRSRLRAPLFVKGTAVKRGDRWFLVQDDGTWVARLSIAPGFSLAAHEGREIVLAGTLNELPSTVAFLQDGRVVADPSRLVAATGSDADWLVRKGVPLDRVRTKPGAVSDPATSRPCCSRARPRCCCSTTAGCTTARARRRRRTSTSRPRATWSPSTGTAGSRRGAASTWYAGPMPADA